MIVKAKGPSGPAKIHSDDPKHALGLVQYLRTIGYTVWIEDEPPQILRSFRYGKAAPISCWR